MSLGPFLFYLVEQFFLTFLHGFWTSLPSQTFPGPTSLSIRRRSLQSATCTAHCSDAGTGGVPWGSPSHLEETSSVSHEFRTVFPMPSPWEVTILGVTVEVGALLPHLGLTDACWVQGCSSKSETPKPPHCASSLLPPGWNLHIHACQGQTAILHETRHVSIRKGSDWDKTNFRMGLARTSN